jgi:hypothetical protein
LELRSEDLPHLQTLLIINQRHHLAALYHDQEEKIDDFRIFTLIISTGIPL